MCNDTNSIMQHASLGQECSDTSEEKGIIYTQLYLFKRKVNCMRNWKQIDNIMFIAVFHWPHEAILLLMTVYMEHERLIKSGKTSMKKFWNIINSELNKRGYNVTDIQCKSKMAGMKNTYKNVKDHNAKSSNNHKRWEYFDVSIQNDHILWCTFMVFSEPCIRL